MISGYILVGDVEINLYLWPLIRIDGRKSSSVLTFHAFLVPWVEFYFYSGSRIIVAIIIMSATVVSTATLIAEKQILFDKPR